MAATLFWPRWATAIIKRGGIKWAIVRYLIQPQTSLAMYNCAINLGNISDLFGGAETQIST